MKNHWIINHRWRPKWSVKIVGTDITGIVRIFQEHFAKQFKYKTAIYFVIDSIEVLDENDDIVWTTKQNVSLHLKNIYEEGELVENRVVKEYLTTGPDGKKYRVNHYNLVGSTNYKLNRGDILNIDFGFLIRKGRS